MTTPRNPIVICACPESPYLGAQKMGTPTCCERCGFMTQDQYDAIIEDRLAPVRALADEWWKAEDEAVDYGPRHAFTGYDCAEMLLAALGQGD